MTLQKKHELCEMSRIFFSLFQHLTISYVSQLQSLMLNSLSFEEQSKGGDKVIMPSEEETHCCAQLSLSVKKKYSLFTTD